MKKIILITIAIIAIMCLISCEKDYPEKVTYSAKNTHGFKLNDSKMGGIYYRL